MFGDIEGDKLYIKLGEANSLIPRLEEWLEMYNQENTRMNLVFFGDCIQHLARIARVLK
jgi:hypothetical protein